jgi:hypothetical protein
MLVYFCVGNVDGAGDMSGGELVWLSYIEDQGRLMHIEALYQCPLGNIPGQADIAEYELQRYGKNEDQRLGKSTADCSQRAPSLKEPARL